MEVRPRGQSGWPYIGLAEAHRRWASVSENWLKLARSSWQMTFRTSEVAVYCSSDSVRSSVRWRSSLSRRVFSMAMTAWPAKFVTSSICLSVKGRTSWR